MTQPTEPLTKKGILKAARQRANDLLIKGALAGDTVQDIVANAYLLGISHALQSAKQPANPKEQTQ